MNRPWLPAIIIPVATILATTVDVAAAPVVSTHPNSQAVLPGDSVSFAVGATGTDALSYQWRIWNSDGAGHRVTTDIPGGTDSTLTIASTSLADVGAYSVVVSDSTGSTESRFAVLMVKPIIASTVFDITDFGAVADGATDSGPAIQAAIDAASGSGGGIVRVPAADLPFVAGLLVLKSNVNFRVESGAILQPLPYRTYQPEVYRQVVPPGGTPIPYTHWLTADGAANIELSGAGTIDGNGSGWWAAFAANSAMPHRPYLIKLSNCTTVYAHDVTLANSPMFHFVPSACRNVTIDGLQIIAPNYSPNTDAIDPSGQNILVQNCYIDVGDDDIVMKPQYTFCCNVHIRDNVILGGHGISIGGQTNSGLDGMLVERCTMTGSDNGLRMKADPSEGGLVQNVTYRDITMTNVKYPIVFYSYYSRIGTPGNTTTATVVSYNTTAPTDSKGYDYAYDSPTMAVWRNITIDGLTATGATGGSIIWGNPVASPIDAFISGVRLANVSLNGGAGPYSNLRLYNVYDAQLSGTNSIATYTTVNALVIHSQPQSQSVAAGFDATFSVTTAGTSGGGPDGITTPRLLPTFRWYRNGVALSDGTQPGGSVVSGASTATLTLKNCQASDAGNYTVAVSNSLDAWDYSLDSPALVGNSADVSATSSAAELVVLSKPRRRLAAATGSTNPR
jgi:polygalacturonase